MLTYVDQRALEDPLSMAPAWLAAVKAVDEPFRTGLHPDQARAFFAERDLTMLGDESTTEAASRLGVAKAQTIPSLYRLATLETRNSPPVIPVETVKRARLPGARSVQLHKLPRIIRLGRRLHPVGPAIVLRAGLLGAHARLRWRPCIRGQAEPCRRDRRGSRR